MNSRRRERPRSRSRRRPPTGAESEGAVVGSLVLDRFLIERRIGSGGFGTVYEAWDGRLERPVAVKAIDSGGSAGCDRVLREAQAAARLNHPGIVTLYEMGEEDGSALLVTELVDGATLDRAQPRRRRSATARSARSAPISARRSTTPTRARVVHRDIKPQNVLVTEDGDAAGEADGLRRRPPHRRRGADRARRRGRHARLHGARAGRGPATSGPEADVYSLALTLYECWTGENPHRRATPAATARAIGDRARPLRRAPPRPAPRAERDGRRLPAAPARPPARAGGAGRRRSRTRSTGSPTPRPGMRASASPRGSPSPPPRPCSASGSPPVTGSAFHERPQINRLGPSRISRVPGNSHRRCRRSRPD